MQFSTVKFYSSKNIFILVSGFWTFNYLWIIYELESYNILKVYERVVNSIAHLSGVPFNKYFFVSNGSSRLIIAIGKILVHVNMSYDE